MTFEETERGLRVLQDNMTMQGAMMHWVENNLDRLEAVVSHMANGQAAMQAAMAALFEHMDGFIRGLESDGHKKRGKS